mmetsp:Transcript_17536/g.38329  ORF Transcript_17536/g.38329 Transcript_17536/m.38329 type:complete len:117 (-) Transcript_17536:94-444(-)
MVHIPSRSGYLGTICAVPNDYPCLEAFRAVSNGCPCFDPCHCHHYYGCGSSNKNTARKLLFTQLEHSKDSIWTKSSGDVISITMTNAKSSAIINWIVVLLVSILFIDSFITPSERC